MNLFPLFVVKLLQKRLRRPCLKNGTFMFAFSKLHTPIYLIISVLVLSSCTKTAPVPLDDSKTETPTEPDTTEPDTDTEQNNEIKILAADNDGKLIIDGHLAKYDCKTTLAIEEGTYTAIVIKNLQGKDGCPIQITNHGLVEIVGFRKHMLIADVSYITVRGNGTSDIDKGFLFRDNDYRALVLDGTINHISIADMAFKNIGNYVISYDNEKAFNGNPESYSTDLSFSRLTASNTGTLINLSGGISGSTIRGLIKNLEISYVSLTNAPKAKNAVSVGMAVDYEIHHNQFHNINTQNDEHNAMFFLRGNGKFYNNAFSSHQGNALRAWGVSIGTTPKDILVYNNIVINSRKYSAFEVQSFESDMLSGKTTFINAEIFNNTCGNLNLSRDWYGVVVDAYRLLGGTCRIFNNLAFNLPAPHPASPFVSYMSIEEDALTVTDNLYFDSSQLAGINNEQECRLTDSSPAKKQGLKTPFEIRDFYNEPRNNNSPSIGAVE